MKPRRNQAVRNFERQAQTRLFRRCALYGLVTLCMLMLLAWAWSTFSHSNYFPINTAKIEGRFEHLEPSDIEKIVKPYVLQSFFSVKVSMLKQSLMMHPWVENASVSRVWPDRLVIQIKEQVPVAFWNNEGYLNRHGELFTPVLVKMPAGVPLLKGPGNSEKVVHRHYQLMQDMLNSLGLSITRLELSSRGAWELGLSNSMRLELGRDGVLDRVKRFTSSYDRVFGSRGSEVDYVDMRYTNGMAVHWKS